MYFQVKSHKRYDGLNMLEWYHCKKSIFHVVAGYPVRVTLGQKCIYSKLVGYHSQEDTFADDRNDSNFGLYGAQTVASKGPLPYGVIQVKSHERDTLGCTTIPTTAINSCTDAQTVA